MQQVKQMEYRETADELLATLRAWDGLITGRGKIRLLACGGTALTLLGYKESTKDVDFLVPEAGEYGRLIDFLRGAGYEHLGGYKWKRAGEAMEYDLFPGKKVFMTELLTSPLEAGGHRVIMEFNKLYLGVLNSYDLMITKLARGAEVDYQDCLTLLRNEKLDWEKFEKRYKESAKYSINYGIGEEKALKNFKQLQGLYQEKKGK